LILKRFIFTSVLGALTLVECEADQVASNEVVLEIEPVNASTCLADVIHGMLQVAGPWSSARIHGVLGSAFSFEMRNGGGRVWQEGNLDQDVFADDFGLSWDIRRFQSRRTDSKPRRADAWQAVRASIDRGIPAVAWCPMSFKPDAPREWGMIIGYNSANETFIIRRHNKVW
jgi:hypothetical protein